MKIQIAPGCFVRLTEDELSLVKQIQENGSIFQDRLSLEVLPHILSLVSKNILKRRNQMGRVRYEVRPNIYC